MKVFIIDNYDSFTYNLYQFIGEILNSKKNRGELNDFEIIVKRNDQVTLEEIKAANPDRIIISPGPGFFSPVLFWLFFSALLLFVCWFLWAVLCVVCFFLVGLLFARFWWVCGLLFVCPAGSVGGGHVHRDVVRVHDRERRCHQSAPQPAQHGALFQDTLLPGHADPGGDRVSVPDPVPGPGDMDRVRGLAHSRDDHLLHVRLPPITAGHRESAELGTGSRTAGGAVTDEDPGGGDP